MAWMVWRLFLRTKQVHIFKRQTHAAYKRAARAFVYLFNVHTLVLLLVSAICVYICNVNNWSYNMDYSMISTGEAALG